MERHTHTHTCTCAGRQAPPATFAQGKQPALGAPSLQPQQAELPLHKSASLGRGGGLPEGRVGRAD